MARAAVPLGLLEVVDVDVSALGRVRDDLVPLDRLDVAQVVVVQDAHAALEDIWGGERLRMRLRVRMMLRMGS